jgi:prephenate dehydrogenase
MRVVGERVGSEGLALAGNGLVDTTRLAASPPEIWKDIVSTNTDHVGAALDALIGLLKELRKDLPEGDVLTEIFEDAGRWRELMMKGR